MEGSGISIDQGNSFEWSLLSEPFTEPIINFDSLSDKIVKSGDICLAVDQPIFDTISQVFVELIS